MLSSHPTISPNASATHSLGAFKVHGLKSPGVDQAKLARRGEERSAIVEEVVERAYDFARTSARYLSSVCGHEEDYYLGLIFNRGKLLHPMPEQDVFSSCQSTSRE